MELGTFPSALLVDLAEDFIGFGRFQVCLLVIAGLGFMADAIEVGVWAKMHGSCMSLYVSACDVAPGFSVQDVITSGILVLLTCMKGSQKNTLVSHCEMQVLLHF